MQPDERIGKSAEQRAETRPVNAPLRHRDLAMITAFWALLAVVTIANRLFDPRGQGPQLNFSSAPVVLPIVASLLWTIVTPALFQLADRVDAERVGRLARVLILLVAAIAAAVLVTVGVDIAAASVLSRPQGRPGGPPLGFRLVNNAIVALGVVAAGLARSYSLRYRAREAQATRLQAQLAEARLSALRQQLDPHFLFNTLNAVSALVERDPRGVRRMISRLSELLRYSIEGSTDQEVPLRQELHWLSRYLDVMQVRFQGRLDVRTSTSDEALDALVPNLILQPLVENAIKHGVGRALGSGLIEIEAEVAGGQLRLRVRDSGSGAESDAAPRHRREVGSPEAATRHPDKGGAPEPTTRHPGESIPSTTPIGGADTHPTPCHSRESGNPGPGEMDPRASGDDGGISRGDEGGISRGDDGLGEHGDDGRVSRCDDRRVDRGHDERLNRGNDRPTSAEGGGVGLRNTMARLEQLYGDAQSFALHRTAEGGAVAELRLPYHTRTDLHVAGMPVTG